VVNDLGGARDGSGAGHNMADQVVAEIRPGGRGVANYDSVADVAAGNASSDGLDAFSRLDVLVNSAPSCATRHLQMDKAMWTSSCRASEGVRVSRPTTQSAVRAA
jgi:NAD(P)-dependent dehydrogenase (short-subunit alcohol dehydrogenase family)